MALAATANQGVSQREHKVYQVDHRFGRGRQGVDFRTFVLYNRDLVGMR